MRLDTGFLSFDLRAIPDYARKAEDLGFGALWAAETKHDTFLPIAVAATSTSRIALGTAIAIAFARSPMVLAQIAWDLQKASGGRFTLHPHLCRRARRPRPRGSLAPAACEVAGGGLDGHGRTHQRRHAGGLRGDRLVAEIGPRIRERYAGLYDCTQLYPSFAPALEDPRMATLARDFNGG